MDVVTYALLSGKVSGVESMVTSLAEGFDYKGSKSSVSALPDDADAGDLYTVDGKKYVWDGTAWVELKDSVELDATLSTQGKAADAKAVGDALVTDTTLAVSGKAADAKKTGDEVSALKTAITQSKIDDIPAIEDKLNKVSGSNLYDTREKEIGVINQDGTVSYNSSYITTGIIPVTPNYKIRSAYRPGHTLMYDANINRILLFDESMQIVDFSTNVSSYIYNIPNNVYYVRCSFPESVETTLMIICDADPQKPASYEPYANYFEATYAFIKTAIDPLISNSIAPVLADMIADSALVENDFRIVNNTLYRITTPVASGGTLTPNTNCIATTITAVLKTLLS